jgi:3-deoxy-D-arabino-heptulosonate 7-phosphate (DAHP) synthase class II
MLAGGFADLRHPEHWEMSHVKNLHTRSLFQQYADKVVDALHFNVWPGPSPVL